MQQLIITWILRERERSSSAKPNSYSEVTSSVGIVIDAINKFTQFKISCPDLLKKQRSIAGGFEPGILNCAGGWDTHLDAEAKSQASKEVRH